MCPPTVRPTLKLDAAANLVGAVALALLAPALAVGPVVAIRERVSRRA